jgi:hypothetical protein
MEIEFLTELKEYKQQRMDEMQSKKDLLEKLKLDYQRKLERSKLLEKNYKLYFDNNIFEELVTQNVQVADLKCEINKTMTQVELMDIGHLPLKNSEIKKQVDDFVNSFKIEKLKETVLHKKEEYLNSLSEYYEAMYQISSTKFEVEELEPITVQGNKETIKTAFYYPGYNIDIDSCVITKYELNSLKSGCIKK